MKKLKILIISLLLIPMYVKAAQITVSGSNTAIVNNSITVTVTLSGSNIGSWQMALNYDKSFLTLTKSSAEAGGTIMANTVTSGISSKSYTFTFKALKSGSTTISVGNYAIYDFSTLGEIEATSSGKKINIMTQAQLEASYSKDNSLKSLTVEGYEISPEFSNDILEYNVVVPEDTKEINVVALVNEKNATVEGEGTLEVKPGMNKFNIIVRAQNGAEKTFTLNVEVKDNNPITVNIEGKEYNLVKIRDYLTAPNTYNETTINIENVEIPAYINETINYTLVGLKDASGNISLYKYDNNKYTKYIEITSGNLTVIPNNDIRLLKNYSYDDVSINEGNIKCLTLNKNSRFKVIFGLNIATNDKGYFLYDTKDQTIISYDEEYINLMNKKNEDLLYITILFAGISFISIIIILSLLKKKKKKVKKNNNILDEKNDSIKKEDKNEIIEETKQISSEDNNEEYDIFVNENKKAKKSKKKSKKQLKEEEK